MAFGKRKKTPASGEWRPVAKDIHEVRLEKGRRRVTGKTRNRAGGDDREGGFSLLEGAMIVCLVGAATYVGYLALPRPLTTTPTRTYAYNAGDIIAMNGGMLAIQQKTFRKALAVSHDKPMPKWMSREELERLPDRYVVRYHEIVPSLRNTSAAIRKLDTLCAHPVLPQITRVSDARKWFKPVTNYVSCALRQERRRLCDPAERRRLIGQLRAYSRMHQKLVGMLRYGVKARMNNPLRGVYDKLEENIEKWTPRRARRKRPRKTTITPRMPREIVAGLRELVRKGYISPYDFSWSGLSVPEEFAPAFAGWRPVAPPCGQATKA